MAIYEYRCVQHQEFTVSFPIGEATREVPCPACGVPAARVFSAPALTVPPVAWRRRSNVPGGGRRRPRWCRPFLDAGGSGHVWPTRTTLAYHGPDRRTRREVTMPEVLFPLDSNKKFTDQAIVGHNRWHPDIPPESTSGPATSFRVDCREWFDGAIHNDDSADDVRDAPLRGPRPQRPLRRGGRRARRPAHRRHPRRRPIPQEDSGPLAGQGWGYTGIFATQNGGGFLTEHFPDAYKVIWDFTGTWRPPATSPASRSPGSCTPASWAPPRP